MVGDRETTVKTYIHTKKLLVKIFSIYFIRTNLTLFLLDKNKIYKNERNNNKPTLIYFLLHATIPRQSTFFASVTRIPTALIFLCDLTRLPLKTNHRSRLGTERDNSKTTNRESHQLTSFCYAPAKICWRRQHTQRVTLGGEIRSAPWLFEFVEVS